METKKVRKEGLDKFYTVPAIAEKCINTVGTKYDWNNWDLVIEPSAGNGSFLTRIPVSKEKRIGIDISPEHQDIIKCDFLTYSPPKTYTGTGENILVIGNPPFGSVSSLAIKFFNHASEWANVIAFIVPRTFRRISVQNKLNMQFSLVYDEEIPSNPCAFSPPMMVKCCFQIWAKVIGAGSGAERTIIQLSTKHDDWTFLGFGPKDEKNQPTVPNGADFAIRAYGGKCGHIVDDVNELARLRPKSWHWIKVNNKKINKKKLIDRFKQLDYSVSLNTARQNSIGRGELVGLYSNFVNSIFQ